MAQTNFNSFATSIKKNNFNSFTNKRKEGKSIKKWTRYQNTIQTTYTNNSSDTNSKKTVSLFSGMLVNIVYNSTFLGYILYKSSDGGGTWTQLCNIVSGTSPSLGFCSLETDGTNVYIATLEYNGGAQINVFSINPSGQTNENIFYKRISANTGALYNPNGIDIVIKNKNLHISYGGAITSGQPCIFYISGTANNGSIQLNNPVNLTGAGNTSTQNTVGIPSIVLNKDEKPVIVYYYSYVNPSYPSFNFWQIRSFYLNSSNSWIGVDIKTLSASSQWLDNPCSIFVPQKYNKLDNGRIWTVWRGYDASAGSSSNVQYAYSDNGGASWSVGNLTTGAQPQDKPTLMANSLNEVFFVWNGRNADGNYYIKMVKVTNNNTFGGVQDLHATSYAVIDGYVMATRSEDLYFYSPLFTYKSNFYGTWLQF